MVSEAPAPGSRTLFVKTRTPMRCYGRARTQAGTGNRHHPIDRHPSLVRSLVIDGGRMAKHALPRHRTRGFTGDRRGVLGGRLSRRFSRPCLSTHSESPLPFVVVMKVKIVGAAGSGEGTRGLLSISTGCQSPSSISPQSPRFPGSIIRSHRTTCLCRSVSLTLSWREAETCREVV